MARNDNDVTEGERRIAGGIVGATAAIFADAVTDIRRRVVEEVLMGKVQDGPASKLAQWGAPADVGAAAPADYDPYDPWGWTKEPESQAKPAIEPEGPDFGR